jgi:D-xylose transport system substrate-binding protein
MGKVFQGLGALFAIATLALLAVAGAPAKSERTSANADVCVLLPDTKTSVRYELFDRPYLAAAFKKAKVSATIVNAQGDAQKMRSQADDCMTNKAKVVLLDALDPGSGAAITNTVTSRGGKVIDYDRLVVGSKASYYISFDNIRVGKLMGTAIVGALRANGKYSKHPVVSELNGDVKDNNAKQFKQGYDAILNPLYKNGTLKKAKGGDQWTEWNAQKALTIFEQMLARNGNKIDASIAANDGIAGSVISALKNHRLKPIPVTGQDATPTGVQYILAGWQTGTVYKSVRREANTAAQAAINLIKGKAVKTNAKVSGTKSILLIPVWITKKNYTLLFKEGFVKRNQVCVGTYKKYCK